MLPTPEQRALSLSGLALEAPAEDAATHDRSSEEGQLTKPSTAVAGRETAALTDLRVLEVPMTPSSKSDLLARFRGHMAALGAPVDHMTDEEIEAVVMRLSESVREAGLTAEQATQGIQRMAEALRKVSQ